MDEDDFKFANDASGAVEQSSSFGAWATTMIVASLMAAAVTWASFAEVEQVTSGQGRVIPTSQVQVVESLDPGIVAEILVREGDEVKIAQPLLRIDDTSLAARLGELQQKQLGLQAEISRLRAEAQGSRSFTAPTDLSSQLRAAYEDQRAIFNINRMRLAEQATVRKQQLVQKRQSLAETVANSAKYSGSYELLQRELEITERLFKKKAVPEIEVLRLRRDALEMKSDIEILAAARLRLVAEVAEMKALLEVDITMFLSKVHSRISMINTELSIVEESIRAAKDRVGHAVLRSPVNGVVNRLNVAAIGEVVTAGATIVEIVPLGDKLLIEARIRPQDIGFISPGLPAVIRLSAYDYTKYGSLTGRVERIGVDTITNENNETFYQIIVSTDAEQSGAYASQLRIIPGMIASVDVSTGKRTILEYLLKPVLRISNRALRDPS